MPRSPWECAGGDGHSAGATMPRRRPRLLRSRTPDPACEAQPQSPDQRPKPRLPESRQFHSPSDTSNCNSRRRVPPIAGYWRTFWPAQRRVLAVSIVGTGRPHLDPKSHKTATCRVCDGKRTRRWEPSSARLAGAGSARSRGGGPVAGEWHVLGKWRGVQHRGGQEADARARCVAAVVPSGHR